MELGSPVPVLLSTSKPISGMVEHKSVDLNRAIKDSQKKSFMQTRLKNRLIHLCICSPQGITIIYCIFGHSVYDGI